MNDAGHTLEPGGFQAGGVGNVTDQVAHTTRWGIGPSLGIFLWRSIEGNDVIAFEGQGANDR